MMELGGNIELVGFKDLDVSQMIVFKKIIGNHARKFSDTLENSYKKLKIHMKKIGSEKSPKYEIKGTLQIDNGNDINSSCTENNVFVCIANVLKKIEAQLK